MHPNLDDLNSAECLPRGFRKKSWQATRLPSFIFKPASLLGRRCRHLPFSHPVSTAGTLSAQISPRSIWNQLPSPIHCSPATYFFLSFVLRSFTFSRAYNWLLIEESKPPKQTPIQLCSPCTYSIASITRHSQTQLRLSTRSI